MPEDAVSPETEVTTQTDVPAADTTTESPVVDEVAAPVVDEEVVETPAVEEQEVETPVVDDEDEEVVVSEEDDAPKFDNLDDAVKAIKDLRKENARRRSQNKDVDAAFATAEGEVDEDFKSGWLEIARLLNSDSEEDNETARAVLARFAAGDEDALDDAPADAAAPVLDQDAILAKLDAKFAEREEALAVRAEQAKLNVQVTELGYKPDAEVGTPEHASHALLWQLVASQPEGQKSLTEAHKSVEAYNDAVFNQRLQALKSANTGLPQRAGGVSDVATPVEAEPVSAADAMKRAEEKSIQFYKEKQNAPKF